MPTLPTIATTPPSPTTSPKPDGADYEPDREWKAQLRKRIQGGVQSMVADAKENLAAESRKTPNTPETRMRLEADYKQLMQTIKDLAMEEYQLELHHERNQRRLSAGIPMTLGWTQYFREKQQNSIKQSSHQTDNSVRTASESPTEKRRSTTVKPSNESHAPAPSSVLPVPRNPSVFSHRHSDEDDDTDDDNDDDADDDDTSLKGVIKARKLRDLEAKKQKLKEYRREADDELERTEFEIQQLAGEETGEKDERRGGARWKEDARRREEEIGRKEAEIRRMEEEVKRKLEAAKRQEDEVIRKTEEFNRKEEEAKQRAVQLEHETEKMKRMQLAVENFVEDVKRMKEETRKKDMKLKEKESILRRREAELIRREADNFRREEDSEAKPNEEKPKEEAVRQEEAKARSEEEVRKEEDNRRQAEEAKRKEDQQQAEFRRRVEEIRRTREERKRNGNNRARSGSSRNLSVPPGSSPGISRASQFNNGPFIRGRSPGLSTGQANTGLTPTWGPSIRPTSASSFVINRSANTSTETPTMGSGSSGTYSRGSSPHPTHFPPSLLKKPREQPEPGFRPLLEPAARPLFPNESQGVFEYHDKLWSRLKTLNELSWNDLPWPMAKQPSNPDDISLSLIEAYIQSPLHPDKSRTPKDRIKDYIKRWHPDSFEAKLRKVVENDRGKVKLGADNVARCLSELLEKENEEESR